MKVLYIVGSCLTKNTSANMSHNGYVQGLLENGCDVDIIMADTSWGESDAKLPMWDDAHYYTYESMPFSAKLKACLKRVEQKPVSNIRGVQSGEEKKTLDFRTIAKKLFYLMFPSDPVYPLNKTWLKNAAKFSKSEPYDLVISNSSPEASHKLAWMLIKSGSIKCKRWIQLWEDPWYYDVYGGVDRCILEEEEELLRTATEIRYVSPLTLLYQKRYFPDCADKMSFIPLPALHYEEQRMKEDNSINFGYFGDYYSHTRNVQPFYDALITCQAKGYIYGDTDLSLESTQLVEVSGRVTLDKLAKVQAQTDILVHLCNLRGGQIPGKIYHYSVTDKPIVFILDGTAEEQAMIKEFFAPYNRYVFCDNNMESICEAIRELMQHNSVNKMKPVEAFESKQVVKMLLDDM